MLIWVFLWCCSFVALVLRLRCSSSVGAVLVLVWFVVCWLLWLSFWVCGVCVFGLWLRFCDLVLAVLWLPEIAFAFG